MSYQICQHKTKQNFDNQKNDGGVRKAENNELNVLQSTYEQEYVDLHVFGAVLRGGSPYKDKTPPIRTTS